MSLRFAAGAALTLALIPVAAVVAQAPESPLTLRVNTQLVEVSVVVKDSRGAPVTDLKASDFEVYDKGKKQAIRVFKVEDYRRAGIGQPAAVAISQTTQTPNARAFSNRTPVESGASNAATVIVIDAGNTWDKDRMTWQDLVYARDQVIKFLRQVRPEDRLGIYLMGVDRFWILHEYTQNCADLVERLATWKAGATPEPSGVKFLDVWTEFAVHFARVDAATAKAIHTTQFFQPNQAKSLALPGTPDLPIRHTGPAASAPGTPAPIPQPGTATQAASSPTSQGIYVSPEQNDPLSTLRAVANHLSSVPGRKNLILISSKMFLPPEFKDQVRVLQPLVQSGVAIYTIDPGGLAPYDLDASFTIPSRVTMGAENVSRAANRYISQSYDWKRQIILMLQSSLTTLAEATGGQVFVNTNDVLGAIRSSFDDSRVTYTLGFYPKNSNNDGSFHPLKVKIPGQEHVSVRFRTGYFEPAPPSRDPHRREKELRQAVWSPVDANAIELSGIVSPAAGQSGYELKLNIGLAAASMQQDGDRWGGQIEVALVQRDDLGQDYEPQLQTLGLKLKRESYEQSLKSGLPYSRTFKLNPKATSLRVVVRDLNSDSLGTLTIPAAAFAQ